MIFFDIDETLLDHEFAEKMGALDFLHKHADVLPIEDREFVKVWNTLASKYFERYLANEISFQEQRRLRMKELFKLVNIELIDNEADKKFEVYLQFYKNNWKAFGDVIPCLEALKPFTLGVISNGDYKQQVEKLERIGIQQYFTYIITSSEIGFAKPHVNIFAEASKKAGTKAEDCFYIGDRLETDALGSKKAGMNGIWLNRKDDGVHEDIIVISSLEQLATIIGNNTHR
jgi:putative hydrolase of the HAD superfamily